MSAIPVTPPFPVFSNSNGEPLENGFIYIGVENLEPVSNPITVYWDAALTIPAAQPIRTTNGYPSRGGTAAVIFTSTNYSILVRDKKGRLVYSAPSSAVTGALINADSAKDASSITYTDPNTGSIITDQYQINSETVSAFRFMTAAQIADVQSGALTLDVTTPLINFFDACSSDTQGVAPRGILPKGKYKKTGSATLCTKRFISIEGEGMWSSQIYQVGAGDGINTTAITYFSPHFKDFAVICDAAGGQALNLSNVTNVTFDGALERLQLIGGTDGMYAGCNGTANPNFFSMKLDGLVVSGISGHAFRVLCGPGVSWIGCYAVACGTGKAGYRLAGNINMQSCNGIDSGDYWGVFGQNNAAADGFQNDFPGIGVSYPDVNLHGTNIERFTKSGILIHAPYLAFSVDGGTIDRSGLATAYTSLITIAQTSLVSFNPARLGFSRVLPGAGVPDGDAALTDAWVYAPAGQPGVIDLTGAFGNAAITGYYVTAYGDTVPFITNQTTNDVYGDTAQSFNAVTARRLSIQMQRYAVPAALTPVGAAQAIVVTGYTKVIVTPAAAASITTATFNQASLSGTDYYRNGDLIIEAGNANLTINHSAAGNYTFRMAAGANLALADGQVVRFCWSSTSNQWIQV